MGSVCSWSGYNLLAIVATQPARSYAGSACSMFDSSQGSTCYLLQNGVAPSQYSTESHLHSQQNRTTLHAKNRCRATSCFCWEAMARAEQGPVRCGCSVVTRLEAIDVA